jgi:hypothetical protein
MILKFKFLAEINHYIYIEVIADVSKLFTLPTQKPHLQSTKRLQITLYFQKFLILTINYHTSLEPAICLSNLPSKLSLCFP